MKQAQTGMSTVEYVLVLALVAIAAIGAFSFFGKTLRNQAAGISTELSGRDSQGNIDAAKGAADASASVANRNYNLGNYNEGANQAAEGDSTGGGGTGGGGPVVD